MIPNSSYAPQLNDLKNRVPSTLTDEERTELQRRSSKEPQVHHKKTALTQEEQVQRIMDEAVTEARMMINEQSDRMRAANERAASTEPPEYQGDTERQHIYDHVNRQRDVRLEKLKAQFLVEETNCYMWMEKKEGAEEKSREGRYKHLFLVVPPNSLGVYRKGREFTSMNIGYVNDLLASVREMYKDADESAPGSSCFCCHLFCFCLQMKL